MTQTTTHRITADQFGNAAAAWCASATRLKAEADRLTKEANRLKAAAAKASLIATKMSYKAMNARCKELGLK